MFLMQVQINITVQIYFTGDSRIDATAELDSFDRNEQRALTRPRDQRPVMSDWEYSRVLIHHCECLIQHIRCKSTFISYEPFWRVVNCF